AKGRRRFKPNSLAPDRATWAHDHRGVMIRVLGAASDPATRLENRVGEPAANPYLYIASQIVAGLAGIDEQLDPGPSDDEPYTAPRTMLPKSLPEALDALAGDTLFRRGFGDVFVGYIADCVPDRAPGAGRSVRWGGEPGGGGDDAPGGEKNESFVFF